MPTDKHRYSKPEVPTYSLLWSLGARSAEVPVVASPREPNYSLNQDGLDLMFFASVVCGSETASSASHFKLCLQPFWQAVSLKSSHERKLGTWLLSGKGCIGSRLEHLYSSVVPLSSGTRFKVQGPQCYSAGYSPYRSTRCRSEVVGICCDECARQEHSWAKHCAFM